MLVSAEIDEWSGLPPTKGLTWRPAKEWNISSNFNSIISFVNPWEHLKFQSLQKFQGLLKPLNSLSIELHIDMDITAASWMLFLVWSRANTYSPLWKDRCKNLNRPTFKHPSEYQFSGFASQPVACHLLLYWQLNIWDVYIVRSFQLFCFVLLVVYFASYGIDAMFSWKRELWSTVLVEMYFMLLTSNWEGFVEDMALVSKWGYYRLGSHLNNS
jgi:hypothetical protein